jgi:hypothetical protein
VILVQAGRAPLALQPSNVIDVPGWEVDRRELAKANQGTPGYLCADCRQPFREPDEDDEGECYCPQCGLQLTDENCLKAEGPRSSTPETAPNLAGRARRASGRNAVAMTAQQRSTSPASRI